MATFDKAKNRITRPAADQVLPLRGGREWRLAFHPERLDVYEIDGQLRWLPTPKAIPFVKGVNGVKHNGDAAHFRTFLDANGWTVLHNVDEYAGRYPARGGALLVDNWTDIQQPTRNRARLTQSDEQKAAKMAWVASLVDNGVIPAPDEYIVEDIIQRVETESLRRLKAKQPTPLITERIAAVEAQLERMRAASIDGKAPKTAKTRKRS